MMIIDITDHYGSVRRLTGLNGLFWGIILFLFFPLLTQAQAPVITYTPLSNTCAEGNRTLIATITSPQGIPTAGSGLPVLYWEFNSAADIAVQGVPLGNDQYSFTFGGTAFAGSVVSYYIVAQNNASVPEVSVRPATGASGFGSNPPSVSTPPTNRDFYIIQNTLASGTYLVGAGQVYTSITDAINAYNNSCLNGPVTFLLTDATYNVNESYPIMISNLSASSVNTLTIKPNVNISTTISGSAESLFKFNGPDYIIFDGSNNGTSTRNMTIQNNSTSPTAAVFWLSSFSTSNGSIFNTIKNCNIYGANANSFAGIAVSSGVMVSANAEASNRNNTFSNNNITSAYYGIFINGVPSGETGNVISQNTIGSTIATKKIGYRSLYLANQTNITVTGNTIVGVSSNFFSGAEPDASGGIFIAGIVSGGEISRNLIYDIKNTNNAGAPSYGISLQASSTATNLKVCNNMIHSVVGYGKASSVNENGIGIAILSGGGYGVYFNSVLLQVNSTVPGITAAIYCSGNISGSMDLRNNIFSNRQTLGTRYAIFCNAARTVFNVINYNDYNSVGYLGYIGGDQYQTIGQWQGATLADGGSVSVDPIFLDATNANLSLINLHLQNPSTLNDQGTPIAGITVDFDGNTRSLTNPDIGADEFTPPACNGNFGGSAALASSSFICFLAALV